MTFIITEPCAGVTDQACVEICPVDCIYQRAGWETFLIHPQECIDCGLCVDACPVEAIYPEDRVPERWKDWVEKNYSAFGFDPASEG